MPKSLLKNTQGVVIPSGARDLQSVAQNCELCRRLRPVGRQRKILLSTLSKLQENCEGLLQPRFSTLWRNLLISEW